MTSGLPELFMRKLFTFLIFLLLFHAGYASQPVGGPSRRLIQNKGQWPASVLYSAEIPQGWLFAEATGFTYNFLEPAYFQLEDQGGSARSYQGHAFQVRFVGANARARVTAGGQLPGYYNYFIGRDTAGWAAGVPAFQQIRYRHLFPHIDLSLYTRGQDLKYDYIVAPGGRVSDIRMQYQGARQLALRNGRLWIRTAVNEMLEEKPYAYQQVGGSTKEVPCVFTLKDNVVGFRITGPYDPTLPLVIDPALVFTTYSGAKTQLSANCATADAAGNTYIASHMLAAHYPVTTGAYQTSRKGGNLAIAKLNGQGTDQLFATFLGGKTQEYPLALAVNAQQELVILAHTTSSDFPMLPGSYDPSYNGAQDYVVAKMSAEGMRLLAATFLGGSGQESGGGLSDVPAGLALDAAGNIYVGGTSQSDNFPVRNAFQTSKKGGSDGVVARLNSALSGLTWSTYLGGSQRDNISDLEVTATGNVVVGGTTFTNGGANDFPATAGVVNPKAQGLNDGFVAVLAPAGNALLAASYLGTGQQDLVQLVEVDAFGNIYAAGFTRGTYPITAGTFGTAGGEGGYFIHKLNGTLTQTAFSTHIGSNKGHNSPLQRVPTAFRVDNCQNIYFSAYGVADAPVTADALAQSRRSLYLLHLSGEASRLSYASYLGGGDLNGHVHQANHSFISEAGVLHQIECTTFSDYPVTAGAFSKKVNGSSNDAAVTKFQFTPVPGSFLKARVEAPPPSCGPYTVNFKNNSEHAESYRWNFSDGSPESAERNPAHTFREPGTYQVRLIASNPVGCKPQDTTYVEVVVKSPPVPALQAQPLVLCRPSLTLDAGNPGYSYRWSTGAQTQSIEVHVPGTYSVTSSLGDCQITESITVTAPASPMQAPNIFTPNQDGRNETFTLENLVPNTRLKIFNRWGKLVYQSDNYQNDWNGSDIAAGTYYYLLESPTACAPQKGWVEVAR